MFERYQSLYTILLDTNILLSMVIPYDIWHYIADELIQEMNDFIANGNADFVYTGLIEKEIRNKSNSISSFISEELRYIYNVLANTDIKFNTEILKEIENLFKDRILKQVWKDKNCLRNRNLLVFAENYLIKLFISNKEITVSEAFVDSISHFNEYNSYMINKVNNFITTKKIRKIRYPRDSRLRDQIRRIENDLRIKNTNDNRILSFFIHHLQEEKKDGLFVTLDFSDLLNKSTNIEKRYANLISITRPAYVRCFFS